MGSSTAATISDNMHHLVNFAALGAAGTLGYQFLKSSSPLVANVAKQTLRTVSTPLATGVVSAAGTLAMYSASSTIADKGYPLKNESRESGFRNSMIVLGSTTFLLTAMLANPLKRLITDHQHSKLGLLAVSTAATATSFLGLHVALKRNLSGDTYISLYLKDKVSDLSEWMKPSKKSSNLSEEQIEQFWLGIDFTNFEDLEKVPNHFNQKWHELFGKRFNKDIAKDLANYLMIAAMRGSTDELDQYTALFQLLKTGRPPYQLAEIFECYPLEVQISIFVRYGELKKGSDLTTPLISSSDPIMEHILQSGSDREELVPRSFASQVDEYSCSSDSDIVRHYWSKFTKTENLVADLTRFIKSGRFHGNPTKLILESCTDFDSLFAILERAPKEQKNNILGAFPLNLVHILVRDRDYQSHFSAEELYGFRLDHSYDYDPEQTASKRREEMYSDFSTVEETSFEEGLETAKTVGVTTAAILGATALSALAFRNITYKAVPSMMVVVPIMTLGSYQLRHERNSNKQSYIVIGSIAGSILLGSLLAPTLSSMMLKNRVGYLEAAFHSAGGVLTCQLVNNLRNRKVARGRRQA